MRRPGRDAAVAVAAGVAGVAGSYVAAGPSPGFVASPVHGVVVAVTPDRVVATAILLLGDLGQQLSFVLALGLAVAALAAGGLAGVRLARVRDAAPAGGAFAGLVAWLVAALATGRPVLALGAAAPVGVAVAAGTAGVPPSPDPDGRRQVLKLAAGVAGFAGLGAVVRSAVGGASGGGEDQPAVDAEVQSMLDRADEQSLDVDGLEGLVTRDGEFYTVDINAFPPEVDLAEWTLTVTGAVPEEVTVDFQEVASLPTERRYETLRCVGESLNGKKMDTAVWTGVPVTDLLDRAGLDLDDECCVMLRAADDYYEEFPLAALEDAILAFEMNGRRLPDAHGFPVRALVPGHWGEINVKWLTEIEVLESEQDGYWEEQGWHGTGPVNTVAKLHAVNHLDDGRVRVGGHAYAGTRGIERVEVSTDGGDSWTDAALSEPLPDPDVWRQWSHTFVPDGSHEVVVRATDGEGELQPRERQDAFPSGPTGWVTKTVQG